MKYRVLLAAGAAFFAMGSAAQAQTVDFAGVAGGLVTDGVNSQSIGPLGTAYLENAGVGGSLQATTIVDPTTVYFRSGAAVSGVDAIANVSTGVDILLSNNSSSEYYLDDFASTIIPAGFGFFLQDRSGGPANDIFMDYGHAAGSDFSALKDFVPANVNFAGANFDFVVSSAEDDTVLYSVFGEIGLRFNGSGNLVASFNLTEAQSKLTTFETQLDEAGAKAFRWGAQDIVVPLSSLPIFNPNDVKQIRYRANVQTFTRFGCLDDGVTCLVSYAAFGDPIGRGGGLDDASALETRGGFNLQYASMDAALFDGLKFEDVELSRADLYRPLEGAVPEPATWAMMIAGFGLAGAALRRRRFAVS